MTLLEAQSVHAAPWGYPLLTDISLSLEAGETLALVGPNGAGKSSLLHLLGGGIASSQGTLRLLGRSLASWDSVQRARVVGLLPQRSTLSFPFTVTDVVMLGRIPHASGASADSRIVQAAMQALDLQELAQRRYPELSGGEQQRVQLARVFAQLWRPQDSTGRLLLLDEPTTALDYAHVVQLSERLRQTAGEGCGIVLVLHDLNLAASLADRVLLLHEGRIVSQGDAGTVFTADTLESVFGIQPMIAQHPATGRPWVIAQ